MKETQWSDEFGYISDGKVYLKGYFEYPDRQIGEVKVSPEASVKYFRDRFETARLKVDELYTLVETAQNKGSYLMKLIHLRQYLAEFDGLGDYVALFGRLDVLEEDLRHNIAHNRVRNLEIKQALLAEAEALKESTEWKETAEVFKELKSKWIRTGAVDREHQDDLEARFNAIIDGFFERRKAFFEHKNRIIHQRVDKLKSLNERAQALKDSENYDGTAYELKKMQEEWKKVGKVPKRLTLEIKEEFKKAYDHFYGRYRAAKNLPERTYVKREDPKVTAQRKLMQEAEDLLQSANIEQAAERGKQLLMDWKNIKVPPRQQDQQLNDRFRLACDKIFEMNYLMRVVRRKNFFFDKKSREEQLSLKIRTMSDLIRREKEELENQENGGGMGGMMNNSQTIDKAALFKLEVQKRKVGVKQLLLDGFKAELAALRK